MSASTSRAPIVFVTGNKNKLKEVQEILAGSGDLQITNQNVDGEWADEVISPLSASLWRILDKSKIPFFPMFNRDLQQPPLAFCSTALGYLAEIVLAPEIQGTTQEVAIAKCRFAAEKASSAPKNCSVSPWCCRMHY